MNTASLFATVLCFALESSSQPTDILTCFGGTVAKGIGIAPGTANYTSLKCFDAVGTNTNACNMTALGFSSTTDMFAWCLAGPPYINLLGCCATCANKISEIAWDGSEWSFEVTSFTLDKAADTNVSFALLTDVILAKNLTCFNGIESTQFSAWPSGYGCARLAASNPNMCTPKTYNMCKFAFYNCRAYCHKINPTWGWCHYLSVGTDK